MFKKKLVHPLDTIRWNKCKDIMPCENTEILLRYKDYGGKVKVIVTELDSDGDILVEGSYRQLKSTHKWVYLNPLQEETNVQEEE